MVTQWLVLQTLLYPQFKKLLCQLHKFKEVGITVAVGIKHLDYVRFGCRKPVDVKVEGLDYLSWVQVSVLVHVGSSGTAMVSKAVPLKCCAHQLTWIRNLEVQKC